MKSKDERYEKYSKTKKTLAPDHDKTEDTVGKPTSSSS